MMLRTLLGRPATVTNRPKVEDINAQQLKARLDSGEQVILLDVRSPAEFQFDGHISGARLLPLPALASRVHELPEDQAIVCVCRSGNRSRVACEMLQQAGFTNVTNLSQGMIGWQMSRLEMNH
jgi:rhodanese-related sulfurtransferase